MTYQGRKYLSFHRGVLESAGLGEVSYFLKKARQQLENARFALEHTEFSDDVTSIDAVSSKILDLNRNIVEMFVELDRAELQLATSASNREAEEEK